MIRDLLVHVDGSEAGRRRLRFAIDLALRTGARLNGLHVMPPPEVPPLYKPSQLDEATANMSLKLASNARDAKIRRTKTPAGLSYYVSRFAVLGHAHALTDLFVAVRRHHVAERLII